jgi:hypothetical protein
LKIKGEKMIPNVIGTIKNLVEWAEADSGDKYFDIVHAIALIFPAILKEQLRQLVNGPIWDGDVISKADQSVLFEMGLAIRVCCKGEQGYTGAKNTAYSIVKKLTEMAVSNPASR